MYFLRTMRVRIRERILLLTLAKSIGNEENFTWKNWALVNFNRWCLPWIILPNTPLTYNIETYPTHFHCDISLWNKKNWLTLRRIQPSLSKSNCSSMDKISKPDFISFKSRIKPGFQLLASPCWSHRWHFMRFSLVWHHNCKRSGKVGLYAYSFMETGRYWVQPLRLRNHSNLVITTWDENIHHRKNASPFWYHTGLYLCRSTLSRRLP